MDNLSTERRSANMRQIRSKNTAPEIILRSIVHRLGYRFRLHRKDLPGKPDLVFPGRRKVIFVHGCFWHLHHGCKSAHVPKSNLDYWIPKLQHNQARDAANIEKLRARDWKSLIIWECEVKDERRIRDSIRHFLENPRG